MKAAVIQIVLGVMSFWFAHVGEKQIAATYLVGAAVVWALRREDRR